MTDVNLMEKYRPKCIAEMILLPRYRTAFEKLIARSRVPHLLFVGPPGVGKTSVALALANDMNRQIVKKNAAAYTNIEQVRTEIAAFATTRSYLMETLFGVPDQLVCILLDEADHIPNKAQAAMRGLMEEAAAMVDGGTFMLTANDEQKIDPAIRSRCAVFDLRYENARDREIIEDGYRKKIASILKAEDVELDPARVDRLVDRHFPDLRAMLNEIELLM